MRSWGPPVRDMIGARRCGGERVEEGRRGATRKNRRRSDSDDNGTCRKPGFLLNLQRRPFTNSVDEINIEWAARFAKGLLVNGTVRVVGGSMRRIASLSAGTGRLCHRPNLAT